MLSIVAYEPEDWVGALLSNALSFTQSETRIVVHLSSRTNYSESTLRRWDRGQVAVNPVRLPTWKGSGAVLYAHLLNARHAESRWPGRCCVFLMQASNMLWVLPGVEFRVRAEKASLGSQQWQKGRISQTPVMGQLLMSHRVWDGGRELPKLGFGAFEPRGRNASEILQRTSSYAISLTSKLYFNLTNRCVPRDGRCVVPPSSSSGPSAVSKPRMAWSYHEGSFYPMIHVLDFLRVLEGSLSTAEIIDAAIHPEELWLQAFMANQVEPDQPGSLPNIHREPKQVCKRFMQGYPLHSHIPDELVDWLTMQLTCNAQFRHDNGRDIVRMHSFYAVKPVARNLSDPRTARILDLGRIYSATLSMV